MVAPQAISRDLDQCLDPSVTTTSVGSGSCGSRRFRLASLQLATFTTLANCASEPAASAGSTMLSPWLEEERVLPKQAVQLRNHLMVVRNGLALELGQSSFDLCGR